MLDRDECRDELMLEAGRANARELDKTFAGIDLSKFVCFIKEHCSAEFLEKVSATDWVEITTKNYQPFKKSAIDGVTVYWETALISVPDYPHFGGQKEYFWVQRAIARRLTGALGADYAHYGTRDGAINK